MESAIKKLEAEYEKRKHPVKPPMSGEPGARSNQQNSQLNKASSTQRLMNSSGSSFKPQASASDVRAGAHEDLDKLSMGSTHHLKKKQASVRNSLKPIPSAASSAALKSTEMKPASTKKSSQQAHASDVITSNSLQHKRGLREPDSGIVIDMGMGPGIQINPKKKQARAMMKDINKDVNQFMKDFEETKKAATAFDDSVS